jgi:hypothetical protein
MQLNIAARKRKQHLLTLLLYVILLFGLINMLVKTPHMENLAFNGLFNYIVATAGIAFILYKSTLHFILIGTISLQATIVFRLYRLAKMHSLCRLLISRITS